MTSDSLARRFLAEWSGWFGSVPPAGWQLRRAFPERWVRFHALPGSKRYAEEPAEREEILRRANVLGDAILQGTGIAWLVIPSYDGPSSTWIANYAAAESLAWKDPTDEPDDPEHVFWAAPVQWRSGDFDALLFDIAEDRVRAVFVDAIAGRVFAPYDGGFDLICRHKAEAEALKERFRSWLSPREDGL